MKGTFKGIPKRGVDHLVLLYTGLSLKARAQNGGLEVGPVVHWIADLDLGIGQTSPNHLFNLIGCHSGSILTIPYQKSQD